MNAGVFQQTVKSAKMVDERKKLHDEQDRRNRRYEEDHADDVSGGAGRQGTRLFGLNSIHSVKFLDPWPILAAADGSGLVTFWSVRCPGRRDATQPFLGRISASELGKGVTSIFFTKIHNKASIGELLYRASETKKAGGKYPVGPTPYPYKKKSKSAAGSTAKATAAAAEAPDASDYMLYCGDEHGWICGWLLSDILESIALKRLNVRGGVTKKMLPALHNLRRRMSGIHAFTPSQKNSTGRKGATLGALAAMQSAVGGTSGTSGRKNRPLSGGVRVTLPGGTSPWNPANDKSRGLAAIAAKTTVKNHKTKKTIAGVEAEHEVTTPQVISVATAEELSKLWWIRYELTVGETFEHPTRGTGTIVKLDFKTSRVHVEFAGREVHRYHEHSWKKFNKESRAARRAKRIRKGHLFRAGTAKSFDYCCESEWIAAVTPNKMPMNNPAFNPWQRRATPRQTSPELFFAPPPPEDMTWHSESITGEAAVEKALLLCTPRVRWQAHPPDIAIANMCAIDSAKNGGGALISAGFDGSYRVWSAVGVCLASMRNSSEFAPIPLEKTASIPKATLKEMRALATPKGGFQSVAHQIRGSGGAGGLGVPGKDTSSATGGSKKVGLAVAGTLAKNAEVESNVLRAAGSTAAAASPVAAARTISINPDLGSRIAPDSMLSPSTGAILKARLHAARQVKAHHRRTQIFFPASEEDFKHQAVMDRRAVLRCETFTANNSKSCFVREMDDGGAWNLDPGYTDQRAEQVQNARNILKRVDFEVLKQKRLDGLRAIKAKLSSMTPHHGGGGRKFPSFMAMKKPPFTGTPLNSEPAGGSTTAPNSVETSPRSPSSIEKSTAVKRCSIGTKLRGDPSTTALAMKGRPRPTSLFVGGPAVGSPVDSPREIFARELAREQQHADELQKNVNVDANSIMKLLSVVEKRIAKRRAGDGDSESSSPELSPTAATAVHAATTRTKKKTKRGRRSSLTDAAELGGVLQYARAQMKLQMDAVAVTDSLIVKTTESQLQKDTNDVTTMCGTGSIASPTNRLKIKKSLAGKKQRAMIKKRKSMIAVKSVTKMRASSLLRQKSTGTGAMAIAAQLGKKAARREVMSANNERANLLAKMKELSGRMLTIHAELDEADQKTAANLATGTFFFIIAYNSILH